MTLPTQLTSLALRSIICWLLVSLSSQRVGTNLWSGASVPSAAPFQSEHA